MCWPFEPEERPDIIESLRPAVLPDEYPYLVEVMSFVMARSTARARRKQRGAASYAAEFEVGLDLILDGLERARMSS